MIQYGRVKTMQINAVLDITEDNKDAVIILLERLEATKAIDSYDLRDLKEQITEYYK